MKTPSFWYQKTNSVLSTVLDPLSLVYQALSNRHKARSTPRKSSIPVLCIGNIVAGGSGKTPVAIALFQLIQSHQLFLSPAFLTRGYLGKIAGPERVDLSHDPVMWGDEALLLAKYAPTIVSKDRWAGAEYAKDTGADVIILDDGLQNYSLQKDLSFCVIDGYMGFGNGKIMPAGPLRQNLENGFSGVDAVILIGEDLSESKSCIPAHLPVFTAKLAARNLSDLPVQVPYLGFCGLGTPEKFKKTLLDCGLNIIRFESFADHHAYTMDDMTRLIHLALDENARLITTEKDFVRLPDFYQKSMIDTLLVDIQFDAPEQMVQFMKDRLAQ
ncbi:MAG TPA: tetraacyldisaccharide 4'-kinase [Alphaproteobacteria bacterium]|nr:tetraacyldisaccharide 4'-kinase [Alphaproteobacteria bacterium]